VRRLALLLLVLAGCSSADARVVRVTVDSAAVGRTLPMRIVVPDGDASKRPLVVFLHGRGSAPTSYLSDAFFAGLDRLGDRAPVVAFPSGGDHSYWHDRDGGDWGRYVLDEVIPTALERSGADPDRVALGGISMGGFGAFDLATRSGKRHFCAVGGHSPAIWRTAGETAPGAFDDAADFRRHDVIRRAGRLNGTKLWLDAGDADPFLPGDRALARKAGARLRVYKGGHDGNYWNRNFARYLSFYSRACAT
jgi:poly(3-hydroxybutyrate) depolymerase